MRIGVVGPQYTDSFAENICAGIADLGLEPVPLGGARFGASRPGLLPKLSSEALTRVPRADVAVQRRHFGRAVRRQRLDGIIVSDGNLDHVVVAELSRRVPWIAFWFPDAVLNLGRMNMITAPYDAVFFKEPFLVRTFRDMLQLPVSYLPEACNPRWHRVLPDVEQEPHVAVVGNFYPYRVELLKRLQAARVPLRLYGNAFPPWLDPGGLDAVHMHEYISRDGKARVMRAAAAVLNSLHPSEIEGVNCRLFEAAGCGATVLCESRPELPRFFDPGSEVLEFHDLDELVDQARWCLEHADDARAIGDRASKRAHAEHSYTHRLEVLLATVAEEVSRPR